MLGFMAGTPTLVVIRYTALSIGAWLFSHRPFPVRWSRWCIMKGFEPWMQWDSMMWPRRPEDWTRATELYWESKYPGITVTVNYKAEGMQS